MTNIHDRSPGAYRAKGRHIEAAWIEICTEVLPSGCSFAQYDAMRMMFFTGAAWMYDVILAMGARRRGGKPIREDLDFLNQLRKELGEFAQKAVLEDETAGNA